MTITAFQQINIAVQIFSWEEFLELFLSGKWETKLRDTGVMTSYYSTFLQNHNFRNSSVGDGTGPDGMGNGGSFLSTLNRAPQIGNAPTKILQTPHCFAQRKPVFIL